MNLVEEIRTESDGWSLKVDKPDTHIWNRMGHPRFHKSFPCVKCEMTFPGVFDPKLLLDAYMVNSRRLKWDDGILGSKDIGKSNKHL
jgi:hypothetical protein